MCCQREHRLNYLNRIFYVLLPLISETAVVLATPIDNLLRGYKFYFTNTIQNILT